MEFGVPQQSLKSQIILFLPVCSVFFEPVRYANVEWILFLSFLGGGVPISPLNNEPLSQ